MIHIRPSTGLDAAAMTDLFLSARTDAMPYLPILHTEKQTFWWMQNVVLARKGTNAAIDKERVLGFITMTGNWIEHLYVSPDAQGRGIGWSLLQSIFKTEPHSARFACISEKHEGSVIL